MLQRQVEDLDQLKARHYAEIIEHEEEVWDVVQGKVQQQTFLMGTSLKTLRFLDIPCGSFISRRFR